MGQYTDPIAHFEEVVARMNAEKKAEKQRLCITINPDETFDGDDDKNIGYAALSCIYHELEINKFFAYRQHGISTEYNMNAIMRLLVFSRLLSPGSKKKAFDEREWFFERCDFTLDDMYRSPTRFSKLREALQVWIHDRITASYGRDTCITYYDVTNYYFEIDKQDRMRRKGFARSTARIRLSRWDCSWTIQGCLSHTSSSRATITIAPRSCPSSSAFGRSSVSERRWLSLTKG